MVTYTYCRYLLKYVEVCKDNSHLPSLSFQVILSFFLAFSYNYISYIQSHVHCNVKTTLSCHDLYTPVTFHFSYKIKCLQIHIYCIKYFFHNLYVLVTIIACGCAELAQFGFTRT